MKMTSEAQTPSQNLAVALKASIVERQKDKELLKMEDYDWFSEIISPILHATRSELSNIDIAELRYRRLARKDDPLKQSEVEKLIGRLLFGAKPEELSEEFALPVVVIEGLAKVLPMKALDAEALRRVKSQFNDYVSDKKDEITADFETTRVISRQLRGAVSGKLEKAASLETDELKDVATIAEKGTAMLHQSWKDLKEDSPSVAISIGAGGSSFFSQVPSAADPFKTVSIPVGNSQVTVTKETLEKVSSVGKELDAQEEEKQ